ncbi:hypothetical protein NC652_037175 [Populus alba x Populus x berolinensis]|nr:hypothetical protein NC652_037175 [Populus alba x Populus x berolinensis]
MSVGFLRTADLLYRQLHLISTSPAVNPCSKECAIWY